MMRMRQEWKIDIDIGTQKSSKDRNVDKRKKQWVSKGERKS